MDAEKLVNRGVHARLFIHKQTKQKCWKYIFRAKCLNCLKSGQSILTTGNAQDYSLLLCFEAQANRWFDYCVDQSEMELHQYSGLTGWKRSLQARAKKKIMGFNLWESWSHLHPTKHSLHKTDFRPVIMCLLWTGMPSPNSVGHVLGAPIQNIWLKWPQHYF